MIDYKKVREARRESRHKLAVAAFQRFMRTHNRTKRDLAMLIKGYRKEKRDKILKAQDRELKQ